MKGVLTRYLNDIVSLTVLGLMTVALIAGQADASGQLVSKRAPELAAPVAQISVEAALRIRFDHED